MRQRHRLPNIWLLSDKRNEHLLEAALKGQARPVGFVFRHYHLAAGARRRKFGQLARIARSQGHLVILSADAATARRWGADGFYAPPRRLRPKWRGLLAITTAHDLAEIGAANRFDADAVMLSPVYPTRSHPGARTLGAARFRLLATRAAMPVLALGGMDRRHARALRWKKWAAIDGIRRSGQDRRCGKDRAVTTT